MIWWKRAKKFPIPLATRAEWKPIELGLGCRPFSIHLLLPYAVLQWNFSVFKSMNFWCRNAKSSNAQKPQSSVRKLKTLLQIDKLCHPKTQKLNSRKRIQITVCQPLDEMKLPALEALICYLWCGLIEHINRKCLSNEQSSAKRFSKWRRACVELWNDSIALERSRKDWGRSCWKVCIVLLAFSSVNNYTTFPPFVSLVCLRTQNDN